ncbi:hypothetical protein BS47DRAFT_1398750 [Hydnum rufescens UP504]|uniref:Uncharacterized protein n=1 Tax=Hydnum rufescens UP504 TaxID=1448309 RepID=A0A9P6DQE0_9AGAM|nr:hypothetical protein BS47DRAFT_1398750 [Hydnum rufescens UP504]
MASSNIRRNRQIATPPPPPTLAQTPKCCSRSLTIFKLVASLAPHILVLRQLHQVHGAFPITNPNRDTPKLDNGVVNGHSNSVVATTPLPLTICTPCSREFMDRNTGHAIHAPYLSGPRYWENVELDLDSELPYISTCRPRFRRSTSICRMSQFTALNPHDDFHAPPFVRGTFRGYICLVGVSNSTPSMARTNEVAVEAALPKGRPKGKKAVPPVATRPNTRSSANIATPSVPKAMTKMKALAKPIAPASHNNSPEHEYEGDIL